MYAYTLTYALCRIKSKSFIKNLASVCHSLSCSLTHTHTHTHTHNLVHVCIHLNVCFMQNKIYKLAIVIVSVSKYTVDLSLHLRILCTNVKRQTNRHTTYPSRPLSVASLSSVSTSFECTANAKSEYVLHIKVLITITAALLPLRPQAQHRRECRLL